MKKITLMAMACLLFAACGNEEAPVEDKVAVTDSELTGNKGRVLSVIPVQNYTYIEVRNNGRNLWLAGSSIEVFEGDVISWSDSMTMRNFYSKALDRTFDEILFVSAIDSGAGVGESVASAAPNVHGAAPVAEAAPPDANTGIVLSTQNAAGYTYVELETESGQVVWLAGPLTEITVGDHVAWLGGSTMVDFTSTTLNRTFEEILFVQKLSVTEQS